MVFSAEDYKRIGNNLKTIRRSLGYKSALEFALALDPNASYPGLSHDMIKKYEAGKYPISEQTLRHIAELTQIPFEKIVFDDLTNSNEFLFDDLKTDFAGSELIENDEIKEAIAEYFCTIFPLFTSKEAVKNKDFVKAYSICETKINRVDFDEDHLLEAVNTFIKLDIPEAYLNVMSVVGRFYLNYYCFGMTQKSIEKMSNTTFYSLIDCTKQAAKLKGYEKDYEMKEIKRKILDTFNGCLTLCMTRASKVEKYKDYVFYYLAARYYFGLMDNDITKLSDEEMNLFGNSMMDCLKIMKNEYAITFKNFNND